MNRNDSPRVNGRRVRTWAMGLALVSLPLAGCSDDDNGGGFEYPDAGPPQAFTLQLLHAADMEAGGEAVEFAPRFSAVLSDLRKEYVGQTVILSSGDNYLPGPFFSASESDDPAVEALVGVAAPGRADILMMNAMGFQASALGNHEFDSGPGAIADLLNPESEERVALGDDGQPLLDEETGEEVLTTYFYPGANFPYLSVNVDVSADEDLGPLVGPSGQFASYSRSKIARSTILKMPTGELIGVVGATTPALPELSNIGGDIVVGPVPPEPEEEGEEPVPFEPNEVIPALAADIQVEVDSLTGQGVNKIVLLAHMQQIAIEKELAGLLRDVDIIVAGGSNTILADDNDRLIAGDEAVDTYPLELSSASDQPVLIVNTDGNYRYVGRLVVTFSPEGVIEPGSLDSEVNGVYAADAEGAQGLDPIAAVADLAEALGTVIIAKDGNTFGKTDVFLEGQRVRVRTEETNLGNLTAEANLAIAQEVEPTTVASIKNGGGIRAPIGVLTYPPGSTNPDELVTGPPAANPLAGKAEGEISQLDIENALRFNNELSLVEITGEQLVAVVEHAVSATKDGATPGQFPQIAGIEFSFDASKPAGERVVSLTILDDNGAEDGGEEVALVSNCVLDETAGAQSFTVVTLNFLAGGGDGYPFADFDAEPTNLAELAEGEGPDAGGVSFAAPGSEQHALARYLSDNYSETAFSEAETPIAEDQRIRQVSAGDFCASTPALY